MAPASNTSSVRQWLTAYAILVGTVTVWFSPWLLGGKALAPFDIVTEMLQPWRGASNHPSVHNHFVSDAVTQYIPYRLFADQSFREDGYLGWNPLIFGGVAQYANTMGLYFDWSMQLHRVLDFWTAWHLGLMIQFLIAGSGMLTFLRLRGCSPAIATFAALAFMTNWQFTVWIYHHWALGSFCWLPWMLFAMTAWRQGAARWGAAVPVFLALAFLGGTLQHAVFIVLAVGCIWLGWLWDQRKVPTDIPRLTGIIMLWGLIGVGLASFMFEPTVRAYLENIQAGHSRGEIGYRLGVLQPLKNLLSYPFYVYPFILGSPQSLDLWKVFASDLFNVGFFGTLPVVLAFLALFSKRVPMAARVLCFTGLIIPLTPLVGPLYHRVHLLWVLGGCWAAAEWLQNLSSRELRKWAFRLAACLGVLTVIWGVASIGIALAESRLEPLLRQAVLARSGESQFGTFQEWMAERPDRVLQLLKIWNPLQIACWGGALLSAAGMFTLHFSRHPLRLLLAIGVFIQSTTFWFEWSTWSPGNLPYTQNPWISTLRTEVGDGRLSLPPGGLADAIFPPNTLNPSGIAVSTGYDSIHPSGMKANGSPWEFPGVSHFLANSEEASPSGWDKVADKDSLVLYRNPNARFAEFFPSSNANPPVRRPSLNTMEIEAPAGTSRVVFAENGARGWYWRMAGDPSWKPCETDPSRALAVRLPDQTTSPTRLQVRFLQVRPLWVSICVAAGMLSITLLFFVAERFFSSPASSPLRENNV